MERGLLSDQELAAHYESAVWLYLFQDFSHSDADRAAERIAIRFGISSWPQHFLVDPFTLTKLADTGRNLESFAAALQRTKITTQPVKPTVAELAADDALAAKLETSNDVRDAKQHLRHADRVVAFRALQTLLRQAPQDLVAEAAWLLAVPNDQIRGLVCAVLAEHGDGGVRDALHALVREPTHSENPNVLRIRATEALARCGDRSSLSVLEPFATSGHYRNGLTMMAIRSVAAIATRVNAQDAAIPLLAKAYPPLPRGNDAATEQRMCESLAKSVHETLQTLANKRVRFPDVYTAAARDELMQSWH
jgi:hypothetical protein